MSIFSVSKPNSTDLNHQTLLIWIVLFFQEYLLQVLKRFWRLEDFVSRIVEIVSVCPSKVCGWLLFSEPVD